MTVPGSVDPAVQISRDMRNLPKETQKAIRPKLRAAGNKVAAQARQNASWSSRIPGTVKVQVSFRKNREGVTVRAGGPKAPHARPYEGLSAGRGVFRHPVWGQDWWVSAPTRPFLIPAAQANKGAIDAEVQSALDVAAAALGFH